MDLLRWTGRSLPCDGLPVFNVARNIFSAQNSVNKKNPGKAIYFNSLLTSDMSCDMSRDGDCAHRMVHIVNDLFGFLIFRGLRSTRLPG